MNRAVPVMEVSPPGSPCRRRSQAAVSCRSIAGTGSDCGRGPQSMGRLGDEKTNVSEQLLRHRNGTRRLRERRLLSILGRRRTLRAWKVELGDDSLSATAPIIEQVGQLQRARAFVGS